MRLQLEQTGQRSHGRILGQIRMAPMHLGQVAGRLTIETFVRSGVDVPVPGAGVLVQYSTKEIDEGVTDVHGVFSIPIGPERAGSAMITITPPAGYQGDETQKVVSVAVDALKIVPFALQKISKSGDGTPALPTSTGSLPWPWILGGLAAAGLAIYVVTKD